MNATEFIDPSKYDINSIVKLKSQLQMLDKRLAKLHVRLKELLKSELKLVS